jgi:hypothetical protein
VLELQGSYTHGKCYIQAHGTGTTASAVDTLSGRHDKDWQRARARDMPVHKRVSSNSADIGCARMLATNHASVGPSLWLRIRFGAGLWASAGALPRLGGA